MTRRDKDKTSLVDFLRSIKFNHQSTVAEVECPTHFAQFNPHARDASGKDSAEDKQAIRSAN